MKAMQTVDIYLSFAIKATLKFLFKISLFLLGVLGFGVTLLSIFEYGTYLSDLSKIELLFFLILAGLLYRHYRYCIYFQVGPWRMLTLPFFALGILTLMYLISIGAAIEVMVLEHVSEQKSPALIAEELTSWLIQTSSDQLVDLALTLIAIFLSTPSKIDKQPSTESPPQNDSEPDIAVSSSSI